MACYNRSFLFLKYFSFPSQTLLILTKEYSDVMESLFIDDVIYIMYGHDAEQALLTFGRSYGFLALRNSRKHPLPLVCATVKFC